MTMVYFTVNELSVSGTVDGVDVVDLVDRSLKKISPTPQAITGAITVNKGVHLDQSPSLTIVNGKDWTTHLSKESVKCWGWGDVHKTGSITYNLYYRLYRKITMV